MTFSSKFGMSFEMTLDAKAEKISDWDDILLRIAYFKRREFFKIWNQLKGAEIYFENIYSAVQAVVEKMEIPSRIRLPDHTHFVSLTNPHYPKALLELPQPPLGLFVQGVLFGGNNSELELIDHPRVGMVGSRKPAPYSIRRTRSAAKLFVEKGFHVISGGAIGIDGEAHSAAIENGGITIAVLGGGFDHLHPRSHLGLFEKILETGGALVSEYPPHFTAQPYTFPERNRIIAALSDILFLAQAHEKSGSLSTARTALDLGREIFVLRPVPGDPEFKGSASLIESGAHCLNDPADLLTEWAPHLKFDQMNLDQPKSELYPDISPPI